MPFKILSLDGGGSWALIQVKVLQRRYGDNCKGNDILRKYDMIIANSGGSIVLAAMCENKSLSEILRLFTDQEQAEKIFRETLLGKVLGCTEMLPRFDTESKWTGLGAHLPNTGKMLLGEIPAYVGKKDLQIIIAAFDYNTERAVYFRSNLESNMESGKIEELFWNGSKDRTKRTVTLLNAIHASSNAPVQFFDKQAAFPYHDVESGAALPEMHYFWDGAISGNNNPIVPGILEAMANGVSREDIHVVSIGTAAVVQPVVHSKIDNTIAEFDFLVKEANGNKGLAKNFKKLATAVIGDPPDSATFIAYHILGLSSMRTSPRLIRINPLVKPIYDDVQHTWKAPGKPSDDKWTKCELKRIFDMDMAVTDKEDLDLIEKLATEFMEDYFENQGVRTGGKGLKAILGHQTFSEAIIAWKTGVWEEKSVAPN